nr:hypothetical protein [Methylobacterium sp. L1A1]
MRLLAASYRTVIALGTVLLGLHLAWAIRWEPARRGEIATGFGACLIILGLWVAPRPYIRTGLGPIIEAALPRSRATFLLGPDHGDKIRAARAAAEPEVRRDVIAERIVAVGVVMVGTLLNGYGPPLVRLLGLEVQP